QRAAVAQVSRPLDIEYGRIGGGDDRSSRSSGSRPARIGFAVAVFLGAVSHSRIGLGITGWEAQAHIPIERIVVKTSDRACFQPGARASGIGRQGVAGRKAPGLVKTAWIKKQGNGVPGRRALNFNTPAV